MWRSQKCNFLVSAKTARTGTGQQTTPYLAAPYWASNRNFQIFGATYRNGIVLAPMQCLYCKEATGVESLKMQFLSQRKNLTERCVSTNYPVFCSAAWARNRNFQNFGTSYRHGSVFAPMQCLYCKEGTGVESPKMQFLSQCKNRTDRCGSTNYPVFCSAAWARNRNF